MPALAIGLPAIIHHHERAVRPRRCQRCQLGGIAQEMFGRVVPVGRVPVIEPIHRLARQPRVRAHLPAEGDRRIKSILTRAARSPDNRADIQRTVAQPHTKATAAHVGDQRHAIGVDRPMAHGRRAGHHTVAVGFVVGVGQKVPRHRPAIGQWAQPRSA